MKIPKEIEKYISNKSIPRYNARLKSARYDDSPYPRICKAYEQAALEPASVDDVIKYTNEFLEKCGLKPIKCPRKDFPEGKPQGLKKFYDKIKDDYALTDRSDIVWMKFTEDGYLGAVAKGADINFSIPSSRSDYKKTSDGKPKSKNNKWIYTNSGIIVHRLGKKWCRKYVLVFPLSGIPCNLNSKHIECGIGNYLIEKGVPILDYYSHRF